MLKVRPAPRLFHLLTALLVSGVIVLVIRLGLKDAVLASELSRGWWLLLAIIVLVAVIDIVRRSHLLQIKGQRHLPHTLALNRAHTTTFVVKNTSSLDLDVAFIDVIPTSIENSEFPLTGQLLAQQKTRFSYTIVPKQRGDLSYQKAQLLVQSRWHLWEFIYPVGNEETVKVYPDFSMVNTSSLLTIERNISYLGAHLSQKRGDGMEFHQLREFRVGDTLRQVDWKATARINKPISREYQEEKDQNVIFLLDASRRMRTKEDNLSYFDHALNALLINSYMALGKGDAVGVMTFSGDSRWLSPVKGKANINQLLNHLYHVDTTTQSSDYINAAENLLTRHRKRSLVIIITNLQDEDNDDILAATRLLTKHHLVMVVALQERLLSDMHQLSVSNVDSALLYSGLTLFAHNRKQTLNQLKSHGVITVDANYKNMHVRLLQEYLHLKRIGRI